jgi:hypothetical protein
MLDLFQTTLINNGPRILDGGLTSSILAKVAFFIFFKAQTWPVSTRLAR